jgi:ectoine hydroxylase-related dioxygenase (phytanoyl-CoA dioxygenase family)
MSTVLHETGFDQEAMEAYFREGEKRALALDNRGPIRFGPDGRIHPDIVEAYGRVGFYIFEGVLGSDELAELRAEFLEVMDRLPTERDGPVDAQGRPALGADRDMPIVMWSKPLGDPLGGTGLANGRHPVKMDVPEPPGDKPEEVPFIIMGPLEHSEAALRVSGHPGLLAVVEAINGEDFVPYNEAFIVKKPGEGAAFSWHQDGTTHWEAEDWTPFTHGFNFMVQMFDCTAANAIWYVPGTHATGRIDIREAVNAAGGNRLPGAVPLICKAGDVAMSNRQILHGSFPNTSADWRATLNLGFHRRKSVVGASTYGIDGAWVTYDDARVDKRSEMIGYGISARGRRFPGEKPFVYRPHADAGRRFEWNEASRAAIRDYQKLDLFI